MPYRSIIHHMMNYFPGPSASPDTPPGTDPEPAVQAEALTVARGPRTVLRALDFTVPRGQITGLLGPSGCGKSTLMRSIVGTQAKVTGTLNVLGRPAGHPALRTRIGYVTQAPSVYDDLTVRQNLDYFAAILDPGRTAATRRHDDVTRAITDVDLTTHADSLAGNLSGGQRSRVSSRSRSSAPRNSSSSTNPPSAWTPYSAATSGPSSTTSPHPAARPSSSPPTSWTRPSAATGSS